MGNKQKNLQELEARQEQLQAQQEQNRETILSLKKELAAEEMAELFSLAKKFSKLFSPSGVVSKAYEELRNKLKVVQDYDPEYTKRSELITDPVAKYFVEYVFESSAFRGGLHKALDRLGKGKNIAGNPFFEEPGK